MKKITIKIGNDEYVYKGEISLDYANNNYFKDVYNCYDRPSKAKLDIYKEWFNELNTYTIVKRYGIKSYNAHLIILNAIVKFKDKLYYLIIRKSGNEIYEIV